MEAVGQQVYVAIGFVVIPFLAVVGYIYHLINQTYGNRYTVAALYGKLSRFWQDQFIEHQVPIDEPAERQVRRLEIADNTCAICLLEPKRCEVSSTCSHSFCGECLFQLYQREQSMIKCPICRCEMHILFKCFHEAGPAASHEVIEITEKIRQYNMRFDDHRNLIRIIKEIPYTIKRLIRSMASLTFLAFFFRSIYFIRLIFVVIFYLLVPFDIMPESLIGVVGYVDDLFVTVFVLFYVLSIVGLQFHRRNQN